MPRITLALALLLGLAACETTEGFGRDVQAVGQEIEEASD
jgi:entericidin B